MSSADVAARVVAGLAFLALDVVALVALLRDQPLQAAAAAAVGLLCGAFAFRRIHRDNPY